MPRSRIHILFLLVGLFELFLVKRWRWKRGLVWVIVLQAGKWRAKDHQRSGGTGGTYIWRGFSIQYCIISIIFIELRGFVLIFWGCRLHKQLRLNMIIGSQFQSLQVSLMGCSLALSNFRRGICRFSFAYDALILHWGYISNLCEFPKGAKQDLTWTCTVSKRGTSLRKADRYIPGPLARCTCWGLLNILKKHISSNFWKRPYFSNLEPPTVRHWK